MGLYDHPDVEKNNRGYQIMERGNRQQGLALIKEAAENGQPNALATLLWRNLLGDEIKEAIQNYETCILKSNAWITAESNRISKVWFASQAEKNTLIEHYKYQVSNSKSNAGLAYLADGQVEKALELWNEAAISHGHVEARFYPIFHLCRENPSSALGILVNSFNKQELQRLIKDTIDISSGSGWLANWAKEGLQILRLAAQNKSGGLGKATATGGGAFVASKQFRDFVQDQVDEVTGNGESISDWLGDLF